MLLSQLAISMALAGPLPVHAAVFAEPSDGQAGESTARAVETLLLDSGSYEVLDPYLLEGRLGEEAGRRFRTCHGDERCWRQTGEQLGVEQVVLVEQVDAETLGIRVLDVTGMGGFRRDMARLQPWGAPDRKLLDRLFFQPGSLEVLGLGEEASLELDGRVRYDALDDRLFIEELSSGKHVIEVTVEGMLPWFATVMVNPRQRTTVEAVLVPPLEQRTRKRGWGLVALLGIAGAGAIGVGIAAATAVGTADAVP